MPLSDNNRFYEIPIEALTAEREGFQIIANNYWVTRNGNPLAWKSRPVDKPQCNANEDLARRMAKWMGFAPDEVVLIPQAYWYFGEDNE